MQNKNLVILSCVFAGLSYAPSANMNLPVTNTQKSQLMDHTLILTDKELLSELNARFIKNFITMDTVSHNEIIHRDFICINSDGSITERAAYMKGWEQGYTKSGYTSFAYTDENIRIFGNTALVIAKTSYTKQVNGETVRGGTIYTDTYIKENGRWLCVQAHITPIR